MLKRIVIVLVIQLFFSGILYADTAKANFEQQIKTAKELCTSTSIILQNAGTRPSVEGMLEKGFSPEIDVTKGQIDIDVLMKAIGNNLKKARLQALRDALQELKLEKDFAYIDLFDTTSKELFTLHPSEFSGENISKALIRFALTYTTAKVLQTEIDEKCSDSYSKKNTSNGTTSDDTKSGEKKRKKRGRRNVAYHALAEYASEYNSLNIESIGFNTSFHSSCNPDRVIEIKAIIADTVDTGICISNLLKNKQEVNPEILAPVVHSAIIMELDKIKPDVSAKLTSDIKSFKAEATSSIKKIEQLIEGIPDSQDVNALSAALSGIKTETINISNQVKLLNDNIDNILSKESDKNTKNELRSIKSIANKIANLTESARQSVVSSHAILDNLTRTILKDMTTEQKIFLKEIISALIELRNIKDNDKERKVLEITRSLVYTGLELTARETKLENNNGKDEYTKTSCIAVKESSLDDHAFKRCLPNIIAHAVLDNITYEKDKEGNGHYQFNIEGAAAPFAQYASALGGDKGPFLHLVIGTSSIQLYNKEKKRHDWIPVVSEQVGVGYRWPVGGVFKDKVDFKLGVFGSGLLYRLVFDTEESDAVFGGVFAAFDLYDTVQLNVSGVRPFFKDREKTVYGDDKFGWSAGIYISLGDYLSELAAE